MATIWRRRGRPPHPEILTPSEQRVLELIREGKTNSEIAYELSISIPGVKWHVSNMLGKLGVSDRHELAAWKGSVIGAASQTSQKRAESGGLAGWLGWKAAVGTGAGLAIAGIVVAAALSRPSTESPSAVMGTPASPEPPALLTASVDFADALSTKVRLELQLASPPTTDYMLSIENGFAIYADGDRNRDYASTMRLLEGGPNSGNGGDFAVEFDPLPPGTQFVEVVFNGTLRKVAMSQAESDRQKTPGAELFPALPPGTTRAAVVRDPVEVDLTDRAPKEFDSGLGWKYVFERVVATSTRIAVTYHVDGANDDFDRRPHNVTAGVAGELPFGGGPQTLYIPFAAGAASVRLAIGPATRAIVDPLQATFTRTDGGWSTWTGSDGPGPLRASISDGAGVFVTFSSTDLIFAPGDVHLFDNTGRSYHPLATQTTGANVALTFEGPLAPDAQSVTLTATEYWVPETREWTVEIPVR